MSFALCHIMCKFVLELGKVVAHTPLVLTALNWCNIFLLLFNKAACKQSSVGAHEVPRESEETKQHISHG